MYELYVGTKLQIHFSVSIIAHYYFFTLLFYLSFMFLVGHISPSELLRSDLVIKSTTNNHTDNISIFLHNHRQKTFSSILHWFQYTFPLMDWKVGIILWKSCGGLLILIAIATIIPGKIHVLSGQIFRWPILVLTYIMIFSELIVYIMVRLFIRLAETLFSTTKHRKLRKSLMEAKSYHEWYNIAKILDVSMGRDNWQLTIDDDTSYTYNWAFIKELIADLKQARNENDAMLTLVVLRQCTRKNVGGVMNEDLFSVTYTGEPKLIVKEFLDEVVLSLKWLTNKARFQYFNNIDTERGGGKGEGGIISENRNPTRSGPDAIHTIITTNNMKSKIINNTIITNENNHDTDSLETRSSKSSSHNIFKDEGDIGGYVVHDDNDKHLKNVEKMIMNVDKDDQNVSYFLLIIEHCFFIEDI